MHENVISGIVVDAAIRIHQHFGPGLLESVYERVLAYELQKRGLRVIRQVPMDVTYDDRVFELGFRVDLLVENKVVVELKSVEKVTPTHHKVALTYVRLTGMRLGLLLNFGAVLMKDGITRLANGLPDEPALRA